ncbi:MAG: hypothetical protein ACXVCY_04135 [Pseudobdellovibrionaceae bacterium]
MNNYVHEQIAGCAVKIYPNGPNEDSRSTLLLYSEILSCNTDRTLTDVGGSFTITLAAYNNFDELIQPDDYIRIFMGDKITQYKDIPENHYNLASGRLALNGGGSSPPVYVMPTDKRAFFLVMTERFVGKIDRVERNTQTGNETTATTVTYTLSGRFLGSIIQDVCLYYNNFVPGLNSWNAFADAGIGMSGSPSDFVRDMLTVVLSGIPMPQFVLPQRFVDDMKFDAVFNKNQDLISKRFNQYKEKINSRQKSPTAFNKIQALQAINDVLQRLDEYKTRSPFSIISLDGIKETYGRAFTKNFMNSQTTGLYDLIKHLSNDAFNEFFMDLCPQGDPDKRDGVLVPTFVMRQRPYEINKPMLNGSNFMGGNADMIDRYSSLYPPVFLKDISLSLWDLKDSMLTVYGPLANSDLGKIVKAELAEAPPYSPQLIEYAVGYSNHDRLNAFLCLGSRYSSSIGVDGMRARLSANDAFKLDADSALSYGFRNMELSTYFASEPTGKKDQSNIYEILTNFSKMLGNWYFANPNFLNGRMTSRFLPDARIGVPCKYVETRITNANPYPKMEIFYVQGVTDNFSKGSPLTTTLTVTRGLRYDLSSNKNDAVLNKDFSFIV